MEDHAESAVEISTDLTDIRSHRPTRNFRWASCTVTLCNIEKQLEVKFPPSEGVEDDPDPILKSNRGGLGVVRKGRVIDGSEYITVVVKFCRFSIDRFLYYSKKKTFVDDVASWCSLNHENILPFLGLAEYFPKEPLCFVSPYVKNGNVRHYLEGNPTVPRLPLIRDVASGLAYLHSKDMIHGDLKGANVLVSDEGRALLCDWGQVSLATYTECDNHGKTTAILQRHHRHWMAFEVFYENEPALFISKPADVWAFAMVVIEVRGNVDKESIIVLTDGKMFTNSEPFGKRTLMEVYFAHKAKRRPQRPESEECDDALWELVCNCWHDDPEERPTVEEVVNRIKPATGIVEHKSSFLRTLVPGWTYRWIRAFLSSFFDRFRKSPRFSR